TTYSFRVAASNATGDSAPSSTAVAQTPPAAPSNLAATAVSSSRIDLAWADNSSNEDGFKLYRSADGVNWVWFASAGANVTAYTWWGAAPNTTYYFRVAASSAGGDSAYSNTATVSPTRRSTQLSNLAATAVSSSRIDLAWADNASNEDGFKLYRSADGVNWVWFATAGANVTSWTWWGASAGATYYFR